MRKIMFSLLTLIISITAMFAQNIELTDKLPNDPKVIVGTLDNGLKYYIRQNAVPEKRAELTLVVNAGSVLEDEDQLGLAHFVEHMAFNGSTNFPENELINYLESIGMKFGPEVNAYTSLDETVYGIKVPTDNEEYVDKGLLVLYDWAFQLTLEEAQIDAERGVIHEEWRMSQGAMDRMQEKYIKTLLNGSIYADRMPIGKMEIVDNFHPDVLRRFYKDWYRPDLMAVVVVGDFDPKQMEQKVINLFSQVKPVENPRERFYVDVPENKKMAVAIAADAESPVSMVQIIYKRPMTQIVNVNDYRDDLAGYVLSSMISSRLEELTLEENPPFAYAGAAIGDFIGPVEAYFSVGMVQNNDIEKTLTALVTENRRMVEYGFTESELERAKSSLLKSFEKQYNERDKQKSEKYVTEYKSNYLFPYTPFPGIEYEYELAKKYIPTINLDEVSTLSKTLVTEENSAIIILMPEKEGVKIPTEKEVLEIYEKADNQKLEPYVDRVSDKPLIEKLPAKGKVAKTEKNKDLDYEVWTLKNGVKVAIKSTNFKDDEILFNAKSFGGYSLYDQKDDISSKIAASVAYESGLGDFDRVELQKLLSDKNVNISPFIGELTEGLNGSSSIQDFETLLQLVHLYFTKPRITESAFNSYINKEKGILENSALSPETAWQDTMQWLMTNYHLRRRPMTAEILDEADYKRVRYIYNQRFSDPSNFTFYFIGNIDKKKVKPLIEQYLGSLPMVERNETFVDLGVRPPKGVIEKAVRKGKDAKCMEMMVFHGDVEYTMQNRLDIDAICKILSTKLLEEIREKESGVYTIGAYPSISQLPYSNYKISIFFSCDPEREKELCEKIMNVIKSLQKDGITAEDINKVVEKVKREYETNQKENSYWRNMMIQYVEGSITKDEYKDYPEMMNSISIKSMNNAAIKFFDFNNHSKVYLIPEK